MQFYKVQYILIAQDLNQKKISSVISWYEKIIGSSTTAAAHQTKSYCDLTVFLRAELLNTEKRFPFGSNASLNRNDTSKMRSKWYVIFTKWLVHLAIVLPSIPCTSSVHVSPYSKCFIFHLKIAIFCEVDLVWI